VSTCDMGVLVHPKLKEYEQVNQPFSCSKLQSWILVLAPVRGEGQGGGGAREIITSKTTN
jgi:hypothetical protein